MTTTQPFRIFGVSGAVTVITLVVVWITLGLQATLLAAILCIIEITFSFDNAIINARVLRTLSPFWQRLFLTIGIVIAVFGMRLVFPIVLVALTTQIDWRVVVDMAFQQPEAYQRAIEGAKPLITSFGGSFLLMLGLHFFFDAKRTQFWLPYESRLASAHSNWLPAGITLLIAGGVALMPNHPDPKGALIASVIGLVTYLIVHGLSEVASHTQSNSTKHKVGLAAFGTFLYLELLDASFSLDGVIGAFAVTSNISIIVIGLGVGALWVRSLTIYMVRTRLLDEYKYLEHGAHYTIIFLAIIMFTSVFFHLPEVVPGVAGLIIIGLSIIASIKSKKVQL